MEKYVTPPDVKDLKKLINRPRSDLWNYNLVGLTHEMKSPLAAIEGALEIMHKPQLDSANNGDDYLGMIRRNVERLKISVDDLLDMYTLGGKQRELFLKPTDIVKICREERDRYKPLTKMKKLNFVSSDLIQPVKVKCDPSKIRLVVSNLLSNAIKFTAHGTIRLKVEEREQTISVTVEDTGRGIATEDLPFVFDGFFQGSGHNTKGSGIGLTISKIWIKAHNGEIHADSEGLERGSRFWFTIPLRGLI